MDALTTRIPFYGLMIALIFDMGALLGLSPNPDDPVPSVVKYSVFFFMVLIIQSLVGLSKRRHFAFFTSLAVYFFNVLLCGYAIFLRYSQGFSFASGYIQIWGGMLVFSLLCSAILILKKNSIFIH